MVVPLCGGNVDMAMLGRVIDRGLAADARLIQFTATVSDRPGGIAGLTTLLAEEGVSIRDIFHERAWVEGNSFQVKVKVVAETSGADHASSMFSRLQREPGIATEVESAMWHFKRDLPLEGTTISADAHTDAPAAEADGGMDDDAVDTSDTDARA